MATQDLPVDVAEGAAEASAPPVRKDAVEAAGVFPPTGAAGPPDVAREGAAQPAHVLGREGSADAVARSPADAKGDFVRPSEGVARLPAEPDRGLVARAFHVAARARDATRAGASAWERGGLVEVGRVALDAAYWRFHPRVRRWTAELPRQRALDEAFDRRFGVDTAGEVPLSAVGIAGADIERGHGQYRPVWSDAFHEALRTVNADFRRFMFVDYGSGKGKALFLAAAYPFEEIVGIEFAQPLHDVAVRNIAKYHDPDQRCRRIRSECIDALAFRPPPVPLVCFFFNPFDEATMTVVLDRLHASVRDVPRDVFVLYCNMRDVSEHAAMFRRRRYLKPVSTQLRHCVFRVQRDAAR
jgi:hypothetical protein